MKLFRLIAALLLATMICILSACGGPDSVPTSDGTSKPKDMATVDESSSEDTETKSETADGAADKSETTDTTSTPEDKETESTTTTPPVVAAHSHSFVGASCTVGGKCECGAAGAPLGHSFTAASCAVPATCKRCGTTNGSALGHAYASGKCNRCGDTNGPLKPGEAAFFRNKLSDEENAQALAVAREIVAQINAQYPNGSDMERVGMAAQLVSQEYSKGVHVEKGSYYNQAYGVFVKRESSCAGCCRALGLVLSCMGYQWSHVNENQWTHQWISLTIDGQSGWADGQIGWVGVGDYPFA